MRIEILAIGDELLDGTVVDTNAAHIGAALAGRGRAVARSTRLPDDRAVLAKAMKAIAQRAEICICTGGLGPTDDDLTLAALADAAGVDRAFDATAWARVEAVYGERTPPARNRQQAMLPVGGRPLYSEVGTAPGVEVAIDGCRFFAVPGVPREMRWFVEHHLLPAVGAGAERAVTLRFAGIGESTLAERIDGLALPAGVEVGYLTRLPENHVRLRGADPAALAKAADQVRAVAPERLLGDGSVDLATATIHACRDAGLTFGAAESCTGGLVGAMLTDVAGASAVFNGSIVSYANVVKSGVLGVPQTVLDTVGAVSEETARAMAIGAREALSCDVTAAITGIAGPGGGSPEKPVGTVWFAWAGLPGHDDVVARRVRFRGDRARVRALAAGHAIDRVRRAVAGEKAR